MLFYQTERKPDVSPVALPVPRANIHANNVLRDTSLIRKNVLNVLTIVNLVILMSWVHVKLVKLVSPWLMVNASDAIQIYVLNAQLKLKFVLLVFQDIM